VSQKDEGEYSFFPPVTALGVQLSYGVKPCLHDKIAYFTLLAIEETLSYQLTGQPRGFGPM